ncbi:hypothetical protein GGD64_002238 [Bradyrhizobium sp. CIR3A]|nr:hypothetical protein [Bradyrhizobium sp. CIR3A]
MGLIDGKIALLYSGNGRPGIATRFVIGLLLKHIYGLSDEGVCERWLHDLHFQYFTGPAMPPTSSSLPSAITSAASSPC